MATNYPDSKNSNSLLDGVEFQDFCSAVLLRYGIFCQHFQSKRFQYGVGENSQGVEIKLDTRCTETKQLSIEIAEKTRASNAAYVSSGIYRGDNTWLYVQGNYDVVYVFPVKLLRLMHTSKKYREHTKPTIKTFYLPLSDADKYAALKIDAKTDAIRLGLTNSVAESIAA